MECLFDVGDIGVREESSHQSAISADLLHRLFDRAAESLAGDEWLFAKQGLQVAPDMLVGVQVGRVARQEMHAKPRAMLVEKATRGRRDVRRMLVEHHVE